MESPESQSSSEAGIITSDGREYPDTPRMRELIRRANKIRENLPAVPEGYVRLWRGNRPDEFDRNPSYTNSLEGIALPFLDAYGGELSYVQIAKSDLTKYKRTDIVTASNAEFILPAELMTTAQIAEDTLRPKQTDGDVVHAVSPESPNGWDLT